MVHPAWNARRLLALSAGLLCYASFWGLGETTPGLSVRFVAPFTNSNAGELQFWLGSALLLLPGGALLGYALYPFIWESAQRARRALAEMNSRQLLLTLIALFVVAAAGARLGRAIFLLDYPITDDEYAARFGGQVLAMGKASVPAFEPLAALPTRFLFLRDGKLSAFDWPGIQLAWAFSEWTRSGPWIFAFASALTVSFLAALVGHRLGRFWGAVAAVLALLSPMICTLSFTSHAHLLSRGLLALALWCYVMSEARQKFGWWVATGFGLGAAFLCRPTEIGCLALPLALSLIIRAIRRQPGALFASLGFGLGGIGPLLAFALFNWAVTGNPLLPARFAANPLLTEPWAGPLAGLRDPALFWHRFGANTSHNLLMLVIWFAGPLGAALAALGFSTDRLTRLLGLGVLCNLGLGLAHDNFGLHLVGPIHYSEAAVPLTVLAVHGMARIKRWCEEKAIALPAVSGLLAGALGLALGTFTLWQSLALQRQAGVQQDIYGFVESAGLTNAIVLAPRYGPLWQGLAEYRRTGSFIYEWRRPRPDWSDEVLILQDAPGVLEPLRQHFANRRFFRLRAIRQPPFLELSAIGELESE
jgi:hypothetical protein